VDISVLVFGGSGDDQKPELRDELLRQAGAQRNAEARGLGSTSVSPVPALASDVANFPPRSMFGEAYEYYRGPRGNHPNSRNWMVPRLDAFAQLAAFAHPHWIPPRPLLMIVGTDADTRGLSDAAVAQAAEPKELFEIEGASHIDLYDKPEYVLPAVAKLTEFFGKSLTASTERMLMLTRSTPAETDGVDRGRRTPICPHVRREGGRPRRSGLERGPPRTWGSSGCRRAPPELRSKTSERGSRRSFDSGPMPPRIDPLS
jgi:hypothetical protein